MEELHVGTDESLAFEYEQSIIMLNQKLSNAAKRLKDQAYKNRSRFFMGKSQKRSKFKAIARRKGIGMELKEKGSTMQTFFCLNDQCAKGWARTQRNSRESFAAAWIYSVT